MIWSESFKGRFCDYFLHSNKFTVHWTVIVVRFLIAVKKSDFILEIYSQNPRELHLKQREK